MIYLYVTILAFLGINVSNDNTFDTLYKDASSLYSTDMNASLDKIEEAIEQSIQAGNKNNLAKAYWFKGYVLDVMDNPSKSIQYYYGAARIYQDIDDDESELKVRQNIGSIALKIHLPEIAMIEYTKCIDLIRDPKAQQSVHFDLGLAYRDLGEYDRSIRNLLEARNLIRVHQEHDQKRYQMSRVYNEIGLVYKRIYEADPQTYWLDSATTYFNEVIDLTDDNLMNFHALNNLGMISRISGDNQGAIDYLELAIRKAKSLNSPRVLIPTYNNLGIVQYNLGKYDLADSMLSEGVKLITDKPDIKAVLYEGINQLRREYWHDLVSNYSYLDSMGILSASDKSAFIAIVNHRDMQQRSVETATLKYSLIGQHNEANDGLDRMYSQLWIERILIGGALTIALTVLSYFIWRWRRNKLIVQNQLREIMKNSKRFI